VRRRLGQGSKVGFSCTRTICVVAVQVVIGVTAVQSVSAQEPTRDLLAAQIRDQSYRCNTPLSADKDLRRSKPDEAVWVLRCKNGTYRLRLVPDMAAHVQRLK
jgi:hypothetical protein